MGLDLPRERSAPPPGRMSGLTKLPFFVRYIVAVGLLAFIYTTLQLLRHGVRLTGGQDLQPKTGLLVDFAGDQVSRPVPPAVLHPPDAACSELCFGDSCSISRSPSRGIRLRRAL